MTRPSIKKHIVAWLMNAALFCGSCFAMLFLIEISLILAGVPNRLDYDPVYQRSQIPGLIYEHKPNIEGRGRYGYSVRTNSIGIRSDQEFSLVPAPGRKRIAIAGDSYAFGHGVPYEDSFACLLEKKMNAQTETNQWEIMNFGISGYSANKMLTVIREKIVKYHPSIIILSLMEFDFAKERDLMMVDDRGFITGSKSPFSSNLALQNLLRKLRITFYLKSFLIQIRAKTHSSNSAVSKTIAEKEKERIKIEMEHVVADFGSICHDNQARCIVAWVSLIDNSSKPNSYGTMLKEQCLRYGVEFCSLADELSRQKYEDLILAKIDMHPNIKGHELIAENLFEQISGETRVEIDRKP